MGQLAKRRFLLAVIFVFLFVSAWYGASYLLSFRTLIIEHKNVHYVAIYDSERLNNGEDPKPIKENVASGEEIKLRKGTYTLQYEGDEGYEDKYVEFNLTDNGQKFVIDPDYNEEKLQQELKAQQSSIQKVLRQKYSKIDGLYSVKNGKLYKKAEWYGATLVYGGNDDSNRDTLRVIMHKEGGSWAVVTDPPDIILSKGVYFDVPKEVIQAVNSLPVPELKDNNTGAVIKEGLF